MSRARDDRKRNTRRDFATTRTDGTPVGSYVITYQDLCVEAFNSTHDCVGAIVGGPSHEPGSHTRANWWIRGPYRPDSLDYTDDDWDES